MLAAPALLLTREVTIPIKVVLPAPLGPSSAKKSPCSTSRSTPRSACTPFLYVLVRAWVDNASMSGGSSRRGAQLAAQLITARERLRAGCHRRLTRRRGQQLQAAQLRPPQLLVCRM